MEAVPTKTLLDEILDFLVSEPSLQQMAEFKASEELEQRLHYLLEQNSQGVISALERRELEKYLELARFMRMLKIRARQELASKSST